MADGQSLRGICRGDDMPAASTVFRWLKEKAPFQEQYEIAQADRAHALAEEALEIADDSLNDYTNTDGGPKLNPEHVQRARLRVDTRKWFASKLAPKKYGDKLSLGGDPDAPLVVEIVRLTD